MRRSSDDPDAPTAAPALAFGQLSSHAAFGARRATAARASRVVEEALGKDGVAVSGPAHVVSGVLARPAAERAELVAGAEIVGPYVQLEHLSSCLPSIREMSMRTSCWFGTVRL
jgi:hypothetical protein